MRTLGKPDLPSGLGRRLLRLPIGLYRARLGWIFGGRLVLVEHIGRRTGRRRQVVLEVVARSDNSAVTVASGFGPRADWYRNLLANPRTTMTLGVRRRPAQAYPIDTDEGAAVMLTYGRRHRRAARVVARRMGYEIDGSDADLTELGHRLPFLSLEPIPPSPHG
jgi:deazaflavin-dependent oxidoreductase (nitroreductase family)